MFWFHLFLLTLPFASPFANAELPSTRVLLEDRLRADFKLNDLGGKLRVANPTHFYALLINGQGEAQHWNDFSFLYRVLTAIYGYDSSHIFIADTIHMDRAPDLNGDGIPDIHFGSRYDEVRKLMGDLKEKLTRDDQLLLVVTDHGELLAAEPTLLLFDREMKVGEFTQLLGAIPAGRVLAIYEQCFGGGFVRSSVAKGRVAMSASSSVEHSWASEDGRFDEFLYHLISAFAMQTHLAVPIRVDTDGNGRISAQEAFSYALGKDRAPESPLLESYRDTGAAKLIGFGF